MAKTNFRGYLQQERVPLKKYFYVLRPLLAVRWLLEYRTPAPIAFGQLLPLVEQDTGLRAAIDTLLAAKRVSPELGLAPQVPAIQRFIVTELARLETLQLQPAAQADAEPLLSDLFRDLLRETWS